MNDRLKPVRDVAAWLDRASQPLWWNVATLLVRQVRADPVLSAALPQDPAVADLLDPSQAPPDVERWAQAAFLTLERFLDTNYGAQGCRPGQLRNGQWGHHWEERDRAQTNDLYVHPVVAWLESQNADLAVFHAGLERWVQRLRWFGVSADEEEFYQEDLGRFLFDSGVAVEDIGREAHSAGGRVDFLLRGHLLIPVELKLWRGTQDSPRLSPGRAPAQSARYARDYRVPRAYLVVVATSVTERLVLPREARTVDPVELLVRVAEVRPPSPSREQRTQVVLEHADLGLEPR